MNGEKISASGERAAISGYLPQFDEFARLVYINLINKELEWIKIADPNAEKLDDIQYATKTEIHAFQVKWTITGATISFDDFAKLLRPLAQSWKSLKSLNTSYKRVIPHLLTNKPLSSKDSIKDNNTKLGSFTNFIDEVWKKLKTDQSYDKKWEPIIIKLREASLLNNDEFNEFIVSFKFQPNYSPNIFSVGNIKVSRSESDLLELSRFIIEKAASSERRVEFSSSQIIKELRWDDRFKTTFNHDLIVDRQKYQPIRSTLDSLNSKLDKFTNGYIFLVGCPGTGKSSLLSYWATTREERIIKYYAFDFQSPSSRLNYYERGTATVLFYDLVSQLKDAGFYKRSSLPFKDLDFLKSVFFEQLSNAGEEFNSCGKKTIIIIDGLDHIQREYGNAAPNFIRELFLPNEIPDGVYIVLGSQTYELNDLPVEIKSEYNLKSRTVKIDPLNKNEVFKYIEASDLISSLTSENISIIFDKSQGHPLYLSYLLEKIRMSENIEETITSFIQIDGEIVNYYNKIWKPIQNDFKLIELIGIITRINGPVNIEFVKEWNFEQSVLKDFREKVKFLFNESNNRWAFFHNSFRQFLLENTAINYLDSKFDIQKDKEYHKKLAEFYQSSQSEPEWSKNYHLFKSEQYNKFLLEATPESFSSQILNFRPVEQVRQDAKLGIVIANKMKDPYVLVRYLFVLSEIERRLYNIDPASFTEEFLNLGEATIAKNYLRSERTLLCGEERALIAAGLFYEFGDKTEASILFNLAYPNVIRDFGILIDNSKRYEDIKSILERWIHVAPNFMQTEKILLIIKNITFANSVNRDYLIDDELDLSLYLSIQLCYSLIDINKWSDFESVIANILPNIKNEYSIYLYLFDEAIMQCLKNGENDQANIYLIKLLNYYPKEYADLSDKIHIANLIYKVKGDIILAYDWIKEITQPLILKEDALSSELTFDTFLPLIKLNKLLNICGHGVSITCSVSPAQSGTDELLLVEFKQMLCLITQIMSEGIMKKPSSTNFTTRLHPIISFYYKHNQVRNKYWFSLNQMKGQYFNFLIDAVLKSDNQKFNCLGDYLLNEFSENQRYWSADIQRKIMKSLFQHGYDRHKIVNKLNDIESFMFDDLDIDGRVTECIEHARVWLILKELDIAKKWLQQSIKESMGVGYRKDYQFNIWIEWLRKTNQIEPGKASDRILWFLSHLNHIRKTTEGKAFWYASKELLIATFEWNFSAGFTQLEWQLDKEMIEFEDSITIFLKFYFKQTKIDNEYNNGFQLYSEILLFISENPNIDLLKTILNKGLSLNANRLKTFYLPKLIDSIKIRVLDEKRYSLLFTVEEFCKSENISITDYYADFELPIVKEINSSSDSPNILILKRENEQILEEDVLRRVNDFENFIYLIQEEDPDKSFFHWSKVHNKIIPQLSLLEINELINNSKIQRRGSEIYAKLSEAALKLKDNDLALKLANKCLELSSESGWVKHFDGGTRINALNLLKKIDPQGSAKIAFEIFANDVLSHNYSISYLEQLDEIIPLLEENYKGESVWCEIFDYLKRLMSNSSPDLNLPEIISKNTPIIQCLTEYLVYLSKIPIPIINESARKLLASSIDQGNEYAVIRLSQYDASLYTENIIVNDVLMLLLEMNSSKLYKFKSTLNQLAVSKNYLLRINSIKILNKLGEKIPTPQRISRPSIYSLYLDEHRKPEINKDLYPDSMEIAIDESKYLMKPFEKHIDILSQESGISSSNLLYRVHSIMKELGKPEEWTSEYEDQLRHYLRQVNLEFPFTKPRFVIAKRALMHLVAELLDSGSIDEIKKDKLFVSHDYAVPLFCETSKPSFIQILKEREFGTAKNNWVEGIEHSPRLTESLITFHDRMKIIGEFTIVRNLTGELRTETFKSQLSIYNKIDENDESIFGQAFHRLTKDYFNLSVVGNDIIIIRDHLFEQYHLKSRWIAINPTLAKYLKWEPESSKLFAWKDMDGDLMAESIFWANGNMDMHPPISDCEAGEGWFVKVSEKALLQIRELEHNLFIQKFLLRSERRNSTQFKKSTIKIIAYEE